MLLPKRHLSYEDLRNAIDEPRRRLLNHPIYQLVDDTPRLRTFMQTHVFAVWDFMSLIKRLQGDLTCTTLPWTPPQYPPLARFANEVILGEESDLGPDGKPRSHLELYLEAMEDVGASTTQFRDFLHLVSNGSRLASALSAVRAPRHVRRFVNETIRTAVSEPTIAVTASFLFGREDLIPDMFERLLAQCKTGGLSAPNFAYYLQRHIELDGEEHGPIARTAITAMAGSNPRAWKIATRAATAAIKSRVRLWDGVRDSLGAKRRSHAAVPMIPLSNCESERMVRA